MKILIFNLELSLNLKNTNTENQKQKEFITNKVAIFSGISTVLFSLGGDFVGTFEGLKLVSSFFYLTALLYLIYAFMNVPFIEYKQSDIKRFFWILNTINILFIIILFGGEIGLLVGNAHISNKLGTNDPAALFVGIIFYFICVVVSGSINNKIMKLEKNKIHDNK